jgi:nitrogen fixation protein FixH
MSLATPSAFRLTGRHVLVGFILFFGLIIGLDVLFASFAYKTFSGQSADNPYEAGLQFNQTLVQRRAEAALGWRADFDLREGQAEFAFTDREGQPVEGLRVSSVLARPATEVGKRVLEFHAVGGGLYRADASGLTGAWDMHAVAHNPEGQRLEIDHRLVLP